MGASNVTTGKPSVAGALYRAKLTDSLTLPTDSTTAMSTLTDFVNLGYLSSDGVTNSNSPESDNVKAWGGNNVLSIQTAKPDTFAFSMLESLDINVLKAIYGTNNVVESNGAITITANADEQEDAAWVIDMILKGGKTKRIVIPSAKITEVGDVTYKDDEAISYPVTITAVPDASGNTHYEYIK